MRIASRSLDRSHAACRSVLARITGSSVEPVQTATPAGTIAAIDGSQIVVAAGVAGVELVSAEIRKRAGSVRVWIDLNAVPPVGIGGVDVMDKGQERDGASCYGAIGVGGTKMKIHRAAIRKLFETNDQILDAEQVLALGQDIA